MYGDEHLIFRDSIQKFLAREIAPHLGRWERDGLIPRDVWEKMGASGFLCPWLPEEHGGSGGDFLHSVVVMEELAKVYESGFALPLHSDVIVPYIASFANEEQKKRWLPGCANGEIVTAIAMTEPGTGSDLANIATTA